MDVPRPEHTALPTSTGPSRAVIPTQICGRAKTGAHSSTHLYRSFQGCHPNSDLWTCQDRSTQLYPPLQVLPGLSSQLRFVDVPRPEHTALPTSTGHSRAVIPTQICGRAKTGAHSSTHLYRSFQGCHPNSDLWTCQDRSTQLYPPLQVLPGLSSQLRFVDVPRPEHTALPTSTGPSRAVIPTQICGRA